MTMALVQTRRKRQADEQRGETDPKQANRHYQCMSAVSYVHVASDHKADRVGCRGTETGSIIQTMALFGYNFDGETAEMRLPIPATSPLSFRSFVVRRACHATDTIPLRALRKTRQTTDWDWERSFSSSSSKNCLQGGEDQFGLDIP